MKGVSGWPGKNIFMDQMSSAVCDRNIVINELYYDHRFFYGDESDANNVMLKPVSGFVRKWMSRYLMKERDSSVASKKLLK